MEELQCSADLGRESQLQLFSEASDSVVPGWHESCGVKVVRTVTERRSVGILKGIAGRMHVSLHSAPSSAITPVILELRGYHG